MTDKPMTADELDEMRARTMAIADGKEPDAPAWVRFPGAHAEGVCWRDQYLKKAVAIRKADEAAGLVSVPRKATRKMVMAAAYGDTSLFETSCNRVEAAIEVGRIREDAT